MKLPISVIILTYNEKDNIEACLKSISNLTDEIFVIDSYSRDSTLEIAARFTSKIYQHAFENFAQQRNWAQDNLPITNEWVFHLDADERVTPELVSELEKMFSSGVTADGLMMPRRTIFRDRWIRHGGHYPVYQLMIFKKDKGRSEERLYDQNYIVRGKIIRLKSDIINIIDPDLRSWITKHRKWAKLEAREILFNKNRVMNIKFKGSPIEERNWFGHECSGDDQSLCIS